MKKWARQRNANKVSATSGLPECSSRKKLPLISVGFRYGQSCKQRKEGWHFSGLIFTFSWQRKSPKDGLDRDHLVWYIERQRDRLFLIRRAGGFFLERIFCCVVPRCLAELQSKSMAHWHNAQAYTRTDWMDQIYICSPFFSSEEKLADKRCLRQFPACVKMQLKRREVLGEFSPSDIFSCLFSRLFFHVKMWERLEKEAGKFISGRLEKSSRQKIISEAEKTEKI